MRGAIYIIQHGYDRRQADERSFGGDVEKGGNRSLRARRTQVPQGKDRKSRIFSASEEDEASGRQTDGEKQGAKK